MVHLRYVDIYRADADSGFALVAQDCIQIEKTDVSRKSNAKSFTMADGSLCLYPSVNDSAEFTLYLECSGSQVSEISAAVRFGELYFAGMRVGSTASATPTDKNYLNRDGYTFDVFTGYIPENYNIQVKEIEAAADLYTVQIPMKLQLNSSGHYHLTENVNNTPIVGITGFKIFGADESFLAYTYRKGAFCRDAVLFTSGASMPFSFSMWDRIYGTDASAKLEINGNIVCSWNEMTAENQGTVTLENGRNDFTFSIQKGTAYKKFILKFTVWKNPEVIS